MPMKVRRCLKMAKAMLGKGKIFISDQMALDFGSRSQQANIRFLRQKSKKNVVIVILRSFESLLNYDKVMYLEKGRIKEFGSAKDLLRSENTHTSAYVKKTDAAIYRKIYNEVGPLLRDQRRADEDSEDFTEFESEDISLEEIAPIIDENIRIDDKRLFNR